jgi:hypothetical protein
MWPGKLLVPADLPRDLVAWKQNRVTRVRVSNSLLSDVALQFIPWDVQAQRALRQHRMPWRNPLASDGAPLFANPQTALFSPFTWPRLLLGLRGWAWSIYLKLLAGSLAMFWLARELRIETRAAGISAVVFIWSGYVTTLIYHPHTNVIVILPALCAACLRAGRSPTPMNVAAVAACAVAATAGGHPETLFVGVIAIAVFLFVNRRDAPALIPFTTAALAGFLMMGVQIVPFLMLLQRSHARVARAIEIPAHFRALSVVSLWLPGVLGSPLASELDLTALMPHGENFVTRSAGYLGALVLLSIVLAWRNLAAPLRAGLWIGIAGLFLSLWIPIVRDVLRMLPVAGWMPLDYWIVPFVIFGSLAAGPALCTVIDDGPSYRLAAIAIVIGVVLIGLGSLPAIAPGALERVIERGINELRDRGALTQQAAVYASRIPRYVSAAKWTAIRRAMLPGMCWALFGVGLSLDAKRLRRLFCVSAALAELCVFGYGYAPVIDRTDVPLAPPSVTKIATLDPLHEWFVAARDDAFPANLGTIYRVRDLTAYDVLDSETKTRQLTSAGYDAFFHGFRSQPTPEQLRVLATMGVRFWIDTDVTELPGAVKPPPARNDVPDGFGVGLIATLAGAILLCAILVICAAANRPDRPIVLQHIGDQSRA